MALYREEATGFVCEFAANPGAGYTLIDAQPSDTLTNRVNWWRDVDKWDQTSEWHPSLQSGTEEIPGNDTRAGSGINIMPDDYSSFEWAGDISPVFTQSASYSRTAAAFYAGQYGVRLTLAGAGGYIGLASTSTSYNIVLTASSKWIFSGFFRPTTASAQTVTITLVTASGSYSITGTTEASSSTWKRISGVFDLSADVALGAQIRISTSTTAASLDFDAIMLEEKVGPYDTPSAYYSPWGNGLAEDEFPDFGIPQSKLYAALGDRIDLIDNNLPGSVNARLSDQYSNLVQQISEVAIGNGEFDSKVIWYFDQASEITGWTTNNATIAVSGGYMTVTATGTSPWFKTATIAVDGAAYQLVRMRVKRTGGTGWTGTLTYFYSSGSSSITISEPTSIGSAYVEASWDMSGETLWKSNTITAIRIQLGTASGDNYSVDWQGIGRNAPGASYEQVNAVRVLADNKNRVFYQTTAPASDSNYTLVVNDLWFDTDDGYKPYRYNGSSWIETTDTRLATSWAEIYDIGAATSSPTGAAAQRVNGISATASSKIKTYYQASTSAPSSPTTGDIWFKTDLDNRAFRWNGSSWVETSDVRIVNLQASVVNKEEAKVGYCSINPGTNTTKAICEAAGGTWTSQPFATAVKQVSVTTSMGTASVETSLQTLSTDTDALQTQYMVKLDVNGYVTGFGLYNNGAGASGFIVRTDKFVIGSASNNTTPFTVDVGTGTTYINTAVIKDASITSAKIGTIAADKITSGTITSQAVTIAGTGGIIQSSNYVTGVSGWRIQGDGGAEFQNVVVRGQINASDINTGTLSVSRLADLSITSAKIASLDAGKINTGTLNAGVVNVTNINASNITTGAMSADRITTGTITSGDIQLSGAGSWIKSNYVSGSSGWIIGGNGYAEFNDVVVRGTLRAADITVGTLTTTQLTSNSVTVTRSARFASWAYGGAGFSDAYFDLFTHNIPATAAGTRGPISIWMNLRLVLTNAAKDSIWGTWPLAVMEVWLYRDGSAIESRSFRMASAASYQDVLGYVSTVDSIDTNSHNYTGRIRFFAEIDRNGSTQLYQWPYGPTWYVVCDSLVLEAKR